MSTRLFPYLCVLLLAGQMLFSLQIRHVYSAHDSVPPILSSSALTVLSFGDTGFLFRLLALRLQFLGDEYGHVTPLKDYDYGRLYQWFTALDGLDHWSDFVPALAGYYYANTQHTPQLVHIIDYLEQHAINQPEKKWWWLHIATHLAYFKLQDAERALALAYRLTSIEAAPAWAKQMPAFIHEKRGEKEQALAIMQGLMEHPESFSHREWQFMHYYIKERLDLLSH